MCAPHLPIHPCCLLEQTVDRRIPVLFVNLPLPHQLKCLDSDSDSTFEEAKIARNSNMIFHAFRSGVQRCGKGGVEGTQGKGGAGEAKHFIPLQFQFGKSGTF